MRVSLSVHSIKGVPSVQIKAFPAFLLNYLPHTKQNQNQARSLVAKSNNLKLS